VITSVLTHLDQLTPEWLTAVLLRDGALEKGEVASIATLGIKERTWSVSTRLRPSYAPGSSGRMPERLFLKIVDTEVDEDESIIPSEVNYYKRDYVGVAGAPLVRCYGAAFSEELHHYYVLLDDLSETHRQVSTSDTETPVTAEYGLALVEGLAAMHAHWWGAQRLDQISEPIHSAEVIERFVAIARPGVGHILACCGDELEPLWPGAIHDIYARHPRALVERTRDDNGFTLIHGDVGPMNIFVPLDGVRPLYILDRQPFDWSLTSWLAAYDLAYAIVLYWPVETRRALEAQMLRHYHGELQRRGVTEYAWERLYDDYRLSVMMCLYVATEWCRGRANLQWKHIWMSMLRKTMTAFYDLQCAELL
jgi:hypothetical protein